MKHPINSPDGTPASDFAFGTMQFGGKADAAAAQAMFDACIDAGITHFDTAYAYTGGASETLLGDFARPLRDRLVIATKAAYDQPATRANIVASAETSLKRMKLEMVDILYLHRFDADTDLRDSFDGLAELHERGLIRHIGLSNFAAWQTVKAAGIAAERGLRVDIIQPMYNLVKRQAEVEILPMAMDLGLHVAAYSPLGGGLLTGKYTQGGTGRLSEDDRYAARYGVSSMHETADALTRLAKEWGRHPATLAAAWVAAHPARPVPILSARNADQLGPSLDALTTRLSPSEVAALTALSPTPPPATDRIEEQ